MPAAFFSRMDANLRLCSCQGNDERARIAIRAEIEEERRLLEEDLNGEDDDDDEDNGDGAKGETVVRAEADEEGEDEDEDEDEIGEVGREEEGRGGEVEEDEDEDEVGEVEHEEWGEEVEEKGEEGGEAGEGEPKEAEEEEGGGEGMKEHQLEEVEGRYTGDSDMLAVPQPLGSQADWMDEEETDVLLAYEAALRHEATSQAALKARVGS